MTIQVITPLPTPVPSRLDPVNFSTRADAFLASLPTFGDELNEFATDANALALQVQTDKDSVDEIYSDMQGLENVMEGIYNNSVATSNFKGVWASLTGALSKPASTFHNGSYWILLNNLTNVTSSEPSDSNTDWLKSNLKALDTSYDSTASSLSATNLQEAVDEVYDYASGYLGNGSATNVSDSAKKTAREWLGVGSFGFKNRLINPEFSISQEFGSALTAIVAGTAIKYVVDQWYATCTGANISTQQIAGVGSNQYSIRLTGANSNTGFMLGQRIESANCYDLKNKNITVSLNAKSTSARTITWTAFYANTKDVFSSKTAIDSGTIDVTTSLENYQFTFNAGSNAGNGIAIEFSGGALLAGSSIDFDAVQLEQSGIATEFEKRSIQQELNACQRYFEIGYSSISGYHVTGNTITQGINFKNLKLFTPTVATANLNLSNLSSYGVNVANASGMAFYITLATGGGGSWSCNWTAKARL